MASEHARGPLGDSTEDAAAPPGDHRSDGDGRSASTDGAPPAEAYDDERGQHDGARGNERGERDGEDDAAEEAAEEALPEGHGRGAGEEDVSDILGTDVIFRRVLGTADEEFARSAKVLLISGVAAGLSVALSFIGRATLMADTTEPVANLLYPIGFVFIVLGRYQLFTENTLTPVALVLTRVVSIPRLLRIWGIVFAANIVGTALAAFFLANAGVFNPDTERVALEIGKHTMEVPWADLFYKGIIAGWLVAGMVWLTHAVRNTVARLLIIFVLMYMIPSADLFHCIIGSTEALYYFFSGGASLLDYAWHFLAPVTLGNTAGGVLLVALLNYGLTREERLPDRNRISWRETFLGERHTTPEQSILEEPASEEEPASKEA